MKTPILKHTVLFFGLLFFFSQCTEQGLILPEEPEVPEVPVIPPCTQEEYTGEYPRTLEINIVEKGELYGAGDEGIPASYHVVRDVATWEELRAQANATNVEFNDLEIDFYNEVVVAVFHEVLTSFSSDVSSIDVVSIIEHIDRVVVKVTTPEGSALGLLPVMNQPFEVVKIPMCYEDNKPIVFE